MGLRSASLEERPATQDLRQGKRNVRVVQNVRHVQGVQVDERLFLSGTSRTKAEPIEQTKRLNALNISALGKRIAAIEVVQ